MRTLSIITTALLILAAWMVFGPPSDKWPLLPRLPGIRKKLRKKGRIRNSDSLFVVLLLCGLYLPSSSEGAISKPLYAIAFLISVLLIGILAWRSGVDDWRLECLAIPIPVWIMTCTVISSYFFTQMNFAPLALFGLLGVIYSLNLDRLRCDDLGHWLAIVSVVNIGLGIGMIFYAPVTEFVASHYTNFYDDIIPSLAAQFKPVTVFATHSLAGTFAYLFFFLNFRTYESTGSRLHLLLACLHVAMCLALASTTSLIFGAVALLELAFNFRWSAVVIAAAILFIPSSIKQSIWDSLTLPGEGNGFLARFGPDGTLYGTLSFIQNYPFLPLGMNLHDTGNTMDSGLLFAMVVGSVPMLLLIHGGLLWFLRSNLQDKSDSWHLFLVLLAAEVGVSTLTYIRSFLLIPAFVIYLNSLRKHTDVERYRAARARSNRTLIDGHVPGG